MFLGETHMPRTDIHRPSVIDPSQYRFVAFDYLRNVAADDRPVDLTRCSWLQAEREKIRLDMVNTGGAMSTHAHGGNCMVCGNAQALYTAMFHHAPSNTYVRMGSDCSHHVNASLDHDAFMRFRARVSRWIERQDRIPALRAQLTSHALPLFVPYAGMETAAGLPDDRNARTAYDIVHGFLRYGSLTDAQWRFLGVLHERVANPNAAAAVVRPNRYSGTCADCHQPVAANAGRINRDGALWTVCHLEGQCPQMPVVATVATTEPAQAPAAPAATQAAPVAANAPAASVGELAGVMALFERARAHLQHPAVVLNFDRNNLRLTVASPTARVPGSLNVLSDTGMFAGRRIFYGRVLADGTFQPAASTRPEMREGIVALLRQFAANPAEVAGAHGRLNGRCCFCRLPLSDPRSTAVGYGEVCAGHYGLPWGGRPAEFAAAAPNATLAVPAPRVRERQVRAFNYRAPTHQRQPELPLGPPCPGCECPDRVRQTTPNHFRCDDCRIEFEGAVS
jgi:hypothetical protein